MEKVTNPKLVDIIIPCFNRLDHTRQTLESLIANTDPDLFQVYIVDDLSTDGTREYLERHMKKFPVFLNEENIGPGASRNWVADWITKKGLRGKYIYHSDNDVYFKEGWLDLLIGTYKKAEKFGVKLLGGGCHPYLQSDKALAIPDYEVSVGYKDAVSGYSQLMTWETWDKYGPFDESMRGQEKKIMGSEDYAFCQKIIKDGFKVGSIEPEVVIATGKTNTYGEPATGPETFKEQEGVVVK